MRYDELSELMVHDVFVFEPQSDEFDHLWECATCGASGTCSGRIEAIGAAYEHKRSTAVPVSDATTAKSAAA